MLAKHAARLEMVGGTVNYVRCCLIAGCLGGLVACSSPTEEATKYYEKGAALLRQGELDKAQLEFQNALQIKDSLTPALYGLAQVAERKGELEKLYGLLSKVVERDPKHLEAQLKLGQVLLAAGQFDRALKVSDVTMALDKDNPAVLALRASIFLKRDDRQAARELAQAALVKAPDNRDALVVLATESMTAGDAAKAVEYLDSALKTDEKNVVLQMLKIRALEKIPQPNAVESVFRQLIAFYPENSNFGYMLAQFYLRHDRSADAEKEYRSVAADKPNDVAAKLEVVRFVGAIKGVTAAEQELAALIQSAPDNNEFRFALAGLRQSQKDLAGAESILREIAEKAGNSPDGIKAKGALASLRLAAGDKEAASRQVDEVLAVDQRNEQALIVKAALEIDGGKLDQAISDLRTVLRDAPDSPRALALLARAHDVTHAPELAETHYQRAFQASKEAADYGVPYAEFLLRHGKFDHAVEVLKDTLRSAPNHVPAMALLSRAYLGRADWVAAQATADQIRRLGGQEKLVEQIQGAIYAGQRDFDKSIAAFKRAHDAAPSDAEPLVGAVQSYVKAGKSANALAFLEDALRKSPGNYDARILLGQVYLADGNAAQAQQAFRTAISQDPKNPAGYLNLAGVSSQAGKYDDARAVLTEGVGATAENFALRLNLAELHEVSGRYEEAINAYEALIKERPNADVLANNLASLLSEHRTDKVSLNRAYELARRFKRSNVPQFKDTVAWASYKVGKTGDAVELLESAVKQLPDLPVLRYHLGMTYLALNKKLESRKQLEKAIELAGDKPFPGIDSVKIALQQP